MKKLKKLSLCAMLAAITCVATMLAIPVTADGYIHPGDSAVLLCAYLLGPAAGSVAAALGSALADLILGYAYYAPATFIIKLLDAALAGMIFRAVRKKSTLPSAIASSVSGLCGSIVMILGYFLYSLLLLGDGISAAASAIPANILQAITGVAVSSLIYEIISSHKPLKRFFE